MNNEVVEEKNGLTFSDLLYIIRKHLLVIIIVLVVFTGVGFGYGKYKNASSPKYIASSSMMVSVEKSSSTTQYQQYQLSQYIKDTFVIFITKDVVLQEAANIIEEQYEVKMSVKKLRSNVSVAIADESLILELTYTSDDSQKSVAILNAIMDAAVSKANSKNDSGDINYKFLYDNIVVLDRATEENVTHTSSTVKSTVIFFALGVVVAFLYVLIRELTNNKFKDVEEVERLLGLPVLAGVPFYEIKEDNK